MSSAVSLEHDNMDVRQDNWVLRRELKDKVETEKINEILTDTFCGNITDLLRYTAKLYLNWFLRKTIDKWV